MYYLLLNDVYLYTTCIVNLLYFSVLLLSFYKNHFIHYSVNSQSSPHSGAIFNSIILKNQFVLLESYYIFHYSFLNLF